MATTVNINGGSLGRMFQGIGGVTSNGMTKLLREYPAAQREDIIDLLFKPKFGASFHMLKVEIGSDANGTCGTEPSHMRSETDFDITRGVGLWLAQQAKLRNPALLLDAIRWGTPAWLTDDSKKYLYYKNFLQGALDSFGLEFDFLAPDENEGDFNRNWVVNTLRPGLNRDGFENVKLTGADSTTDWNIASMVSSDSGLKKALYAINAHYKQDSPDNAKNCGLPIFDSEDVVAYRHKFSSALDMAYKIIRSYASGRMVQYQMHPVIEAIYDNVPYTYKSLLTAAHPWTGHYLIEPALWVTAQFTQFIEPGWYYINSGCHSGNEHSYLTLKDSSTGDFSIIVLNRSANDADFTFQLSGLDASSLHVWMTREEEQFVNLPDAVVSGGSVSVSLPPYSICTLTTTSGQTKGKPANGIPAETSFALPYRDDFESYELAKQPRYTVDQSGAFEIHEGGKDGGQCLKQVITRSMKPTDWERRPSPSPYTILGGQELKNYKASLDFYMEPIEDAGYEGYAMLGIRCNFSPTGNVPAECYNIRIFYDGRWQLRCAALLLASGQLADFALETWHHLCVSAKDNTIEVFYDNNLLASVQHEELPSGHVVIGSGYNRVRFDNFAIEAIDPETPVECIRYKELDERISYIGSWAESGSNAKNYTRTLLTTSHTGDQMEFAFNGTSVSILGMPDLDCGKADVYVDHKYVSTVDMFSDPTKYRKVVFSAYGLEQGDHTVRLVVAGNHNTDSTGNKINIDAVEVTGGSGLIPLEHTPIPTAVTTDETVLHEDFAATPEGSVPDGWTVQAPSGTSCGVTAVDGEKCLSLSDRSSSNVCYASKTFDAQEDRLTIRCRYRTEVTGKWFRLYAMDGATNVIEIYDSNVNGLCYRNKFASDLKITDISANEWYDIRLDIDVRANLYAIFVNNELKCTGCTFRRNGTKIDGIRFESGSSFVGQAWFSSIDVGLYALAKDSFGTQAIGHQPLDWKVTASNGTSCTVEAFPDENTKSARLYDNTSSQQVSMMKPFAGQTGRLVIQFKLHDSNAGTWSRVLLSDGSTDAIAIYNSDLDGLCYRNNSGKDIRFADFTSEKWYDIMVVADVAVKRFDIYVDGELRAAGCEFRNVVPCINQITLASGESYTGTTYFRDVTIMQGIDDGSSSPNQ